MLIVIEGIDGAGKTTIANFLVEKLSKKSHNVVKLEEPSNSKYGKALKESSQTEVTPKREFRLFMKDRKVDVEENIVPALNEGKIVIMDRYYYSHVYQAAKGLDLEKMMAKNRAIAPKPDLTILLDVPVKTALQRIGRSRKKRSRFEFSETYLKNVRKLYLNLAEKENFEIIDGQKTLQKVKHDVLSLVQTFIKNREAEKDKKTREFS